MRGVYSLLFAVTSDYLCFFHQILQHPSALVRFYGVLLLVAALKSCVTALSQIRKQKGKVMGKGVPFNSQKTNEKKDDRENEPRFNQREEDSYTLQADAKLQLDEWNEYEESLLRDVRSRLPDLQVCTPYPSSTNIDS